MKRHKDFVIANMAYRLQDYHPEQHIELGRGNSDADILVIQERGKVLHRDAISGALKVFNILDTSYRTTSVVVSGASEDLNRYYLKELIGIIQPMIIVACGPQVMSVFKERRIKSFSKHAGRRFKVSDLSEYTFYAVTDPSKYSSNSSRKVKTKGKAEWSGLMSIYKKMKEKMAKERWA